LAETYARNEPFAHVVIDNFLTTNSASQGAELFPSPNGPNWIHYLHYNENKCALTDISKMPKFFSELIGELSTAEFLSKLECLTGVKGLVADPSLQGGGLHLTKRGGHLNVHADFTAHPITRNWRRRVNLLLYFNSQWNDSYEGHLELWSRDMTKCVQRISPILNRCVIFNTDANSFHGVPTPLNCPIDMTRNSLALYYYTESITKAKLRSTNYQARPNAGDKKSLIWADKLMVAIYTRLKSKLGVSDRTMGKVLEKFKRKR